KAGDAVYTNPGNFPYDGHGHQAATFVLFNMWYDCAPSSSLRPYVGGGLGVAFVDQKVNQPDNTFGPDGTDTAIAFQLGAGVNIPLTSSMTLDIGYRFRGILDADIRGQQAGDIHANQDIYTHNVIAGIKLTF